MKRLFNILSVLALLGCASLTSCYDDKGNYDYHELSEVRIDTADLGIQEAYVISRYDKLEIEPNVYYNGKLANHDANMPLDYVWTIYSAYSGANVDKTVDTIGHQAKLDAEITRTASSYYILLTVTNREDGTEQYFKVKCQVEESITAGWMLLYEPSDNPGKSDIGLVVNPLVKKNIIQNKEFWNLYSSSNGGQPMDGNPIRIMRPAVDLAKGSDPVFIQTDKDFCGLNNDTFERILNLNQMFYETPSTLGLSYYGVKSVAGGGEIIINDNKLYTSSFSGLSRNDFFGQAKTGDYGSLAPYASEVKNMAFDAVVYDNTNGNFLGVNRAGISLVPFASQDATCPVDVNNVGMKYVMSDWGRNYQEYYIMDKDDNRYLVTANFSTANSATNNIGTGLYNITNSPNVKEMTSIAAPFMGEFLLYSAANSVYCLRYASSTEAVPLWTAPDADEEVTCVRLQKYYFRTIFLAIMPNANTVMHVATWNKRTNEGKLYEFTVNPASGVIMGDPLVYNVPGKVKDMAWKYVMER